MGILLSAIARHTVRISLASLVICVCFLTICFAREQYGCFLVLAITACLLCIVIERAAKKEWERLALSKLAESPFKIDNNNDSLFEALGLSELETKTVLAFVKNSYEKNEKISQCLSDIWESGNFPLAWKVFATYALGKGNSVAADMIKGLSKMLQSMSEKEGTSDEKQG